MRDPLDGRRGGAFTNLPRRIYLTYRYRGGRQLLYRGLTFPLRFTPLRSRLRLEGRLRHNTLAARRWYRRHGRPVTIVIPSYRDAELVRQLVRGIRRTTRASACANHRV